MKYIFYGHRYPIFHPVYDPSVLFTLYHPYRPDCEFCSYHKNMIFY